MNVTYSDKARRSEHFPLLQQATARLEEAIGRSVKPVKVEWDETEDEKSLPLYTLQISDWAGTSTETFTPADLAKPIDLSILIYRIWGHVLQARSHKQLEAMQRNSNSES